MKSLILLFSLFTFAATAQQIDTIYTDLTPVKLKRTTLVITTAAGDQVTETKEVFNLAKAEKKLEALERDTTQYNQYLVQLDQTEQQIKIERRKARLLKRDAIDLIDKLRKILPNLK